MKTRTGYLLKRGRVYYAAWTIGGKKFMKSTHKTDKRKAQTELARIMQPFLVEDEVRTLETVKARIEGARAELTELDEERNPPLTVRAAWATYRAAPTDARRPRQRKPGRRPDTAPTTLTKQEFKFNRFAEWLGREHPTVKCMQDVTETIAEEYEADLERSGMADATFNAHLGLLQLVWTVLSKKAKTKLNPWMSTGRKAANGSGRRELTLEELREVCGKAEGEMRTLLAIGLYSGLRLGDAATLRWSEADLERGLIQRIPAKTARRNQRPVQVPMHRTVRTILTEARDGNQSEYVLPETAALYMSDASAVCKLIQAHFERCRIRTHRPGTGFETVTGEDGKPVQRHTGARAVVEVGYHSLRHSFVSLCRAANVPLVVVEALVSHASPAVTRLYSHTGEDAASLAVNGLPDVTSAAPALPPADPLSALKGDIRALAEKLTTRTVKQIRGELLALVQ